MTVAVEPSQNMSDGAKHVARRRLLARIEPQVHELYGPDARTALFMAVALPMCWSLILLIAPTLRWPLIVAMAWAVGSCLHHTCFLSMHEAVHDLVFEKVRPGAARPITPPSG